MEKSAKSRKVMCFVCQATFSIVVTVVLFRKIIKKYWLPYQLIFICGR